MVRTKKSILYAELKVLMHKMGRDTGHYKRYRKSSTLYWKKQVWVLKCEIVERMLARRLAVQQFPIHLVFYMFKFLNHERLCC